MVSVLHDDDYLLDILIQESEAKGEARGEARGEAIGEAKKEKEIMELLRKQGFSDKKIREMLNLN